MDTLDMVARTAGDVEESQMIVFDEEIVENEISEGKKENRSTTWTLVLLGCVGGTVLVTVVVVVMVVMVRCIKNMTKKIYKVKEGMEKIVVDKDKE